MFLALWYYLHGYVIIEVSGFSVERFVNMAAYRGIYIWDICPQGVVIRMKVSKQGCQLLDECAQKTGCRYTIIEERGLPSAIRKYQKRKILVLGVLFFMIGLYLLSSFIWIVEVKGNERIAEADILLACEEMGLKPGAWKPRVNLEEVTEGLLEGFSDIAWASVKIKGTNVRVDLVETIPQPEIVDKHTPSNVIAQKDGMIVSIAAEAGSPLRKAGDVVKSGDILISGEIKSVVGDETEQSQLVRARGAVFAKVWEIMEDELPLTYTEKQYTDECKKDYSIIIKDSILNIIKPRIEDGLYDKEKVYEKNAAIGDYKLPIALAKEEYKKYIEVSKERTVEEAKEELKQSLTKRANELQLREGSIQDISISYEEEADKVTARAIITIIERIDEEQKIDHIGRNAPDGANGENTANGS